MLIELTENLLQLRQYPFSEEYTYMYIPYHLYKSSICQMYHQHPKMNVRLVNVKLIFNDYCIILRLLYYLFW